MRRLCYRSSGESVSRKSFAVVAPLLAGILAIAPARAADAPDHVYYDAKVWTGDPSMPVAAPFDAAYASFDEADKGTISAGKYADFVVLSQDILALPPERLLDAKVLLTVMGGRETYRAPGFAD